MSSKHNYGIWGTLAVLSLSCIIFSSCGKNKGTEQVVVQAYPARISLAEVQQRAENVAVQYANYMRNGFFDAAYDLVYTDTGVFFTLEDMQRLDEISKVQNKYVLTDVTSSGNSVILTYMEKIGEAYSKKTDTYIGEVCTSVKKIAVPVCKVNGEYYIAVNEDYLSTEQIALKVPDGCGVWFGDSLLDPADRDDSGYYILSEFTAADTKSVHLDSAIEERELLLVLNENCEMPEKLPNVIVLSADQKPHNGLKSYTYEWEVSRETVSQAAEYSKTVFQKLYEDAISGRDFTQSSIYEEIAETGNPEQIKPEYMKLANYFRDTNTTSYNDLVCVAVNTVDEDTMRRRQYSNCLLDSNTMRLRISADYSYLTASSLTHTATPHTGTVYGYIYLSRENGVWKLSGIDGSLLKNVR